MALVAAVLFFTALLLHELGHAVQARREGLEVDSITLWLFGGVAQFKGEFPSAGAEFRIAIAGPAVTAVLGGSFLALAAGTQLSSGVDGVAAWLAYINFLLLVFNLLPALPLDGGRIFRSALWRARGDFAWATGIAVDVSRVFAFLLIALGFVLLLVEDAVGGIWLAFIGWFLLQAASFERRDLALRSALAGLRVRDLMRPYPSGLLGGPWGEWMLPPEGLATFAGDEPALGALERLSATQLRRGIVVDDGRLVGVLSIGDFARVLSATGPPGAARPGYS